MTPVRALLGCLLLLAAACSPPGSSEHDGLIFADDFSDSATGWHIADPTNGVASYQRGALSIEPASDPTGPAIATTSQIAAEEVTNVVIEVDVIWSRPQAEDGGIACRVTGIERRYTFSIGPDRRFDIGKKDGDEARILLFGRTEAIKTDRPNRLKAVCNGSHFALHINDELVGTVEDSSIGSGTVGLRSAPLAPGADETQAVFFDDLVITRAPPAAGELDPSPLPRKGNVVLEDAFEDPGSGWLGDKGIIEGDGFKAEFNAGSLRVELTKPGQGASIDSTGVVNAAGREMIDLSNVSIEADAILESGPGSAPFGLYCRRGDPNQQAYYQSFITGDGDYVIVKWAIVDGEPQADPLAGGFSSDIAGSKGVLQRLRFDCFGALLTLSVDGRRLAQAQDSLYETGRVGLAVEPVADLSSALVVRFDALELREVTGPDSAP